MKLLRAALALATIVAAMFTTPRPVAAELTGGRVVVTGVSQSQVAALGIVPRHVLSDLQFSADLTANQIQQLELLGGVVTPTLTRAIAPLVDDGESAQVSAKGGGGGGGGGPKATDPVPWGVERIVLGTASGNNALPAGHETAGVGVVVAVIDTGVDTDHSSLVHALSGDSSRCYNFAATLPGPGCEDDNGHGTHVTGTIVAKPTSASGVWGVAPGAAIMALKACDAGGACSSDDIAAAIRRAADGGAKVISMSVTASAATVEERAAYDYAAVRDVVMLGAAGNGSGRTSCTSVGYPAYSSRVISVAATDKSDAVASYSCRGNNLAIGHTLGEREDGEVELAAPGSSVVSTAVGGGLSSKSGTSMATAHLSGLVARLLSTVGGKGFEARSWMSANADDITSGTSALPGEDAASGRGLPDLP